MERQFRDVLGFYPTSKGNEIEHQAFLHLRSRVVSFLSSRQIHSGNIRSHFYDLYAFSHEESFSLFDYARTRAELASLLPCIEACHSYIMAVCFSILGERHPPNFGKRQR